MCLGLQTIISERIIRLKLSFNIWHLAHKTRNILETSFSDTESENCLKKCIPTEALKHIFLGPQALVLYWQIKTLSSISHS